MVDEARSSVTCNRVVHKQGLSGCHLRLRPKPGSSADPEGRTGLPLFRVGQSVRKKCDLSESSHPVSDRI